MLGMFYSGLKYTCSLELAHSTFIQVFYEVIYVTPYKWSPTSLT